jgi:murein DD-endopeptidase MepM/ murein hydrolase activator NlpD
LDYGATIILQHQLEGLVFYTLYGHLTLASLETLSIGKEIKKGEPFTAMGNRNENGGWVPHLHFQIVKNMMNKEGDFPGVASDMMLPEFYLNCPDPNVFFIYQ